MPGWLVKNSIVRHSLRVVTYPFFANHNLFYLGDLDNTCVSNIRWGGC